jgi:predicted MPP superfamily phosphohydrolase
VLARVAAGQVPDDDHLAALLQDHGAIVPRKSGWTIENCVLRRHLQGANEAPAPPDPPKPARTSAAPVRVFTWVHLSDLHFGAGTTGYRFDHKAVMRAIGRDLAAHAPRSVDRIFVTGDIAFSATPKEYDEAKTWLEKTVQAAGVSLDRLRLVPGNHDIDRQIIKKTPLLRSAHHAARDRQVDLDDLLADKEGRAVLAAKLEPYRSFVSTFAGHPPPLPDNGIDWVEILDANPAGHGPLRIVGLSTVWTSDDLDGKDLKGKGFVRNLMLAQAQLDRTSGEATGNDLTFVLTHHPPDWIAPDGAKRLRSELARLPHIHLCGHVHDAEAGITKRYGRSGRSLWYVAGAAHSDPAEAAKHGYAWGALRYDPIKARWQAGWAPRVYVPEYGEMRADATRHDLEQDGFAWEDIDCLWPAPAG